MTTYLDIRQLEAYVAAVAGRAGVSVQWDKPEATPRTDGRTVWLPAVTSIASAEWMQRIRYYIKHETSHVEYSDFEYLRKQNPQGALALLNNLFEDNRIDYLNDAVYLGDKRVSDDYWKLYTSDLEKLTAGDAGAQEQARSVIAAFMLDATCRSHISSSVLALNVFKKVATDDNLQQLEMLLNAGCEQDLLDLRSITNNTLAAEACFTLAKKVFSILFPEHNVEEQYGKEATKGKGKGKPSDEDGDGEGTAGGDMEDRIVTVDKIEKAVHKHTPSRTGIHLEHEVGKGAWQVPAASDYIVLDFDNVSGWNENLYKSPCSMFKKTKVSSIIENEAKPLANKLRIKLQTQSKDRYEYGKKRGKLHGSVLSRVLMQDSPISERVFKQRKVSTTTDTAVTLLVDCSGSMSGMKFEHATAVAGMVAEALRPLNISCRILGFTNENWTGKEQPMMLNFKKWGETVTSNELVKRFSIAANNLLQNSDGDAVAFATWDLTQRKETRKVLIVLSDGSPSGRDWAGSCSAYTKKCVQDAEKVVDVYGIGIEDYNVRKYYTNNIVVEGLSNLAPTVLSVLDKSFKG
jgi:hypothetical protein